MTRELLSLDDLPPSLLSAARTLVAVPSPDGVPLKYKAALTLGSSLGGTGQGFTVRGAWTPATAYAANDVVSYGGTTYVATQAFTSDLSFSTNHLALWAAKGDPGAPGPAGAAGPVGPVGPAGPGFVYRGAWTPATAYAANDVLTYDGQTYVVTSAFTSGLAFDAGHLALWAAKGADGAGGGGYMLPVASRTQLGGIKADGTTLVIASDGTASAAPDATAARLTDPRFRGIQRIDLKAAYGARCDGISHPLAGVFGSLAAATAVYPNAGLTGANWAAMELDTAAFLQAEYDVRTGTAGAGVIGLNDGAIMMVSQQLNMQDTTRTWFHGGRNVKLITAGCGTTPALRVANCSALSLVLSDLAFQAKAAGVGFRGDAGGVAQSGFAVGASFLEIDNCQGMDIERVGWNGYDRPIVWGNHVYGIHFIKSGGGGNNVGLNYDESGALDSMEGIYFERGTLSNNNYGFDVEAVYGTSPQYSQGGSVFIKDSSIDYNIVRAGIYRGSPDQNSYSISSLHLTGNHIETTGACSGSALSRILAEGPLFMSHNECCENDGVSPVGYVEVADLAACSMTDNRFNSTAIALMYSATSAPKRVQAYGNVLQSILSEVVMMKDASGWRLQPSVARDGSAGLIFNQIADSDWAKFYNQVIMLDYSADGSLTLPSREVFPFPTNYVQKISNAGKTTVTLAVTVGTSPHYTPVVR